MEKITLQKIFDTAKIEDFTTNLKKSGKSLYTTCPFCNKTGKAKGLIITPDKQIWKCFSCEKGGQGAVSFIQASENLSKYEAILKAAEHYSIDIETKEQREARLNTKTTKRKTIKRKTSFLTKQLKSSGLTIDDITAVIYDKEKNKETHRQTFFSGTRNQYGQYVYGQGDDMLIEYYDLEGNKVMYKVPKSKDMYRHLVRVRWSNPELHIDKFGKPIKYQSPAGSGSHLYIPQKVRSLYKRRRKIDRLYIQEGEKKAEKSCKEGLISVGVMGIQNLGSKNQLPADLQTLIIECEVDEVIFLLDSDWDHLGSNLKNGDNVDQRPRNFFYAVKNFKDYMRTMVNLNISLEIYFAHVKENERNDKGIDDLLTNTLKESPKAIVKDADFAIYEKSGEGKYLQFHKITMESDAKIADYWHLNSTEKFTERHKNELKKLKEFKLKKLLWRYNEGKLELAQPILPNEQYWEVDIRETKSGDIRKTYNFDYANCFEFLKNRGFYRLMMQSGEWVFVHIENKVIKPVDNYYIKDFVTTFTKEIANKAVLNMLYKGGPQYLGYEKLSNIDFIKPPIERPQKTKQNLYFKDKIWEIDINGIKESPLAQMKACVWQDKVKDFSPKKLDTPLLKVRCLDDNLFNEVPSHEKDLFQEHKGEFLIFYDDQASKCDFLQFFINTSKFFWRKERKGEELTHEEKFIVNRHIVNKMTAMGYLLHSYKNDSEGKAIVCMDGKMSEVGSSNGRTGKSLFGLAVEQVISQVYIPAKGKALTEDPFLYEEVTEKTQNLFLDDVRANLDFEFFFPLITGKLKVNVKGKSRFTLKSEDSPKLLISTNHAINGQGSSFRDRQGLVAFCDYYNDNHKPIDDFGKNFFKEWEQEQWNLFYNFMGCCLQVYFQVLENGWGKKNQGFIDPPLDDLEKRRLRQQIGENFLMWADTYFSNEEDPDKLKENNLNQKRLRKDMQDNYLEENPTQRKFFTPNSFSKKIKFYCEYKGFHFNPDRPNADGIPFDDFTKLNPDIPFVGETNKTGSKEYYTIADNNYLNLF